MARRIFRNIVFAAVLAVVLTAMLIVPALYNVHEASMTRELRQELDGIACALELTQDDADYLQQIRTDSRVTLIAADGTVLFDNMADAAKMENHAGRPEVEQALATGSGESTRTSDTLSETTLYCARCTEDGSVLRLGNTRRSMLGTFLNVAPLLCAMLLCVALVSLLLARRAAKRIIQPINSLNLDAPLDNDTYDELAPLLTRMHRQHEQIERQMRALEHARAELMAIMQNMREGMILLDQNETVLSINASAERILGVDADAAVGRKLLNVDRDADLHELVQRSMDGMGGSLAMEKNERHYMIYVSPVGDGAQSRGTVLLILDVTERFEAEQSRREFTANVSHELKTPLTSISGFAEIIRDGIAQPQDVERFAGKICAESARLIALVNDILELSRLDEQQRIRSGERVALKPLLEEIVDGFELSAQKKQLSLKLSCGDAAVHGDRMLLRELFFNLVDNAVKYTDAGGHVCVTVEQDAESVACTVSDDGVGIPAEHQAHVFERFYRVDKSHSRATGGTGLGLAIVKHVAQLHGARLNLRSAEGQGTQICVTFVKEI